MKTFLVHVGDDNFSRVLPKELDRSKPANGRVKVMAFPPLGIQTLAPVLRGRGHEVRMFDTCHPRMKAEHIAQAVAQEQPAVIALSFLSTTTYPAVKSMARRLKAEAPKTPIIAGGPFATLNADRILGDCLDIDSVGVGEGEDLLPDYLDHLDAPDSVAGLVWRRDGRVVENAARPLLQDLDQFPYPDRTSLPIDYIESLPLDVPAVLSLDKFCTVQTSRGCPYSCIYCDIPSLGEGRWRSRSPEHVLGELQELNDLGYRSIYLTDDHFLINRRRIEEICRGIIERKLAFHWGCEGRVDSVGIDQLAVMRQAGCNFLAFGVEAGTKKVLKRLNKKQTPAQVEHAVREAKHHGIDRVHGFFVIGSPDENEEDILDSFRFAARLELDTFGFNRLCAYRGTPLWAEYVARGIIDDERDGYKWFKCSDIDPTTVPSALVNRLRAKGYGLLFLHRILKRPIRTWRLLRAFGRHMKTTDIVRLLCSPFRRRTLTCKPELPARMLDAGMQEPDRSRVPAADWPRSPAGDGDSAQESRPGRNTSPGITGGEPSSDPLAWRELVAPYQKPVVGRSVWQVVSTLVPYAILWFLMCRSLAVSYWLTLPLAILAGGFHVRVFIILHDCGHGSFFKSRKAADWLGVIMGVLTFVPYYHWRWQHSVHHSSAGDLDRRGLGDITTWTVQEYLEASRWQRLAYRLMRNPVVLFGLAPLFVFLAKHRFTSSGAGKRERHSVYWTNLAVLGMVAAMSWMLGFKTYLVIQLTVMAVAGSAGLWLFYVQHQFEGVAWARHGDWDYVTAALQGSSFYKLPKVLQWFTGSIGFHHIHHLRPGIPNYNLEKCHQAVPLFQTVKSITLFASLKSLTFRLWDEQRQKLVGFGGLRSVRRRQTS